MAGCGENIWSVCQEPPKFFLSSGVLMISRISGWPFMPSMNGCRWMPPQRRAKASCWSGVSDWLRKKDDEVVEQGGADFAEHLVADILRRSTPDFRAEGAGDLVGLQVAILRVPRGRSSGGVSVGVVGITPGIVLMDRGREGRSYGPPPSEPDWRSLPASGSPVGGLTSKRAG